MRVAYSIFLIECNNNNSINHIVYPLTFRNVLMTVFWPIDCSILRYYKRSSCTIKAWKGPYLQGWQ